jgi:hypothetical protein
MLTTFLVRRQPHAERYRQAYRTNNMKINYNSTFKLLLDNYTLPSDLNFEIDIPLPIRQLFADKIVKNDFGISLERFWTPTAKDDQKWQSFHEDNENHFHIDSWVDVQSDKIAFEIGVKTLIEIARTLQSQKIDNVQLTYSFQTPDMGRIEAKECNLHDDDDDDYYISDRLSFHIKRDGQNVVSDELFENRHSAFLKIDI